MKAGVERTSDLFAPTVLLEGHQAPVLSVEFSPSGSQLASASFDKTVELWSLQGECTNTNLFEGHKSAVLEVHWSTDETTLYSCSADGSAIIWDVETGERVKPLRGHSGVVNSLFPARHRPLLVTGSDDCTAKVWDVRMKGSLTTIRNDYQITAVTFGESAEQIFYGGIDCSIHCVDLRKSGEDVFQLQGHSDIITGIALSPNGHDLLSNAMDNTVRIWDVRPFSQNRATRTLEGVQHGIDKLLLKCRWSPDGRSVSAGSANKFVIIWNSITGRIIHQLPGHKASVNDVAFHPSQPIIASASSDKTMFVGELS
jgi:Prp8 binding protein